MEGKSNLDTSVIDFLLSLDIDDEDVETIKLKLKENGYKTLQNLIADPPKSIDQLVTLVGVPLRWANKIFDALGKLGQPTGPSLVNRIKSLIKPLDFQILSSFCPFPEYSSLRFLEAMKNHIQPFVQQFKPGSLFKCMITGLRRSGKTTLTKLFVYDCLSILQEHKIFVFIFDCKTLLDGRFSDGFLPWIRQFFNCLKYYLPDEAQDYLQQFQKEYLYQLTSKFESRSSTEVDNCYGELIDSVYTLAQDFGFSQVFYVLDEFEKTFPIWSDQKGIPMVKSFNQILKVKIDDSYSQNYFLITGTDALQLAVACIGGGNDGTSLLTRCLENGRISTSGVVSFEDFAHEMKENMLEFEFPRICGVWTQFTDYGGIASYLAQVLKEKDLAELILEGVQQDFANIPRILHFKPHLKSSEDIGTVMNSIKRDFLLLLNGAKTEYLNDAVLNFSGFFRDSKACVKIATIVYGRFFDTEKLPLGLPTVLQLEINSSVLGWKIQEAVASHIETNINISQNISFFSGNTEKVHETFQKFFKIEHLDYSFLNIGQLEPNTLYFDKGIPTSQRWIQSHLPGIDAMSCNIEDNFVSVFALQIKSSKKLEKSSVDNTIFKFLAHRQYGSVLCSLINGCFNSKIKKGTLKIVLEPGSLDVTSKSYSYLKSQSNGFDSLSFTFETTNNQTYTGTVMLYILIVGSFDLRLLSQYKGIRFVWGYNQLKNFLGRSLEYLLLNKRIHVISIMPGEDPHIGQLEMNDRNYKTIKIFSDRLYKGWLSHICLNDTTVDDLKTYFTNKFNFLTTTDVHLIERESGYELKFDHTLKRRRLELLKKKKQQNKKQKYQLEESLEGEKNSHPCSESDEDSNDGDWKND
eukprot:TRINITY_DN483_c0_g2_i1.p1 TRINITY_DN483_c0_g2~~TRINITY_DN483_c0_g2_i1.p1  ORF type:complete len:860 (+),score=134.23 TRINITY_DN483_c0_g2_i1:131-2710(+)